MQMIPILMSCLLLAQSTLWASSPKDDLRSAASQYAPAAQLLTKNCIRVDINGKLDVEMASIEQGRMRGAYYTSGRRFFGQFEAVTIIDIQQNEQNEVVYEVQVLAYPHVAISRFFARQLGLIERYFKSKSQELESLTVAICQNMVE